MLSSVAVFSDRYHGDLDGTLSLAMTRSARRGPWLPEEDQALLQLVRTQGANNWVRISQQIKQRSPKQCRERYHQNLKPSLKHDPISAQEGEVIERLVQEMGKRWAEIARRLGNRSDNAVKNWWNGSVNRRRRNPPHATTGFKQRGTRLQPVAFTLPQEHNHSRHPRSPLQSNNNHNTMLYENQEGTDGPFRPTPLQIPSPVHAHTTSTMAISPGHPLNQYASSPDERIPITSNTAAITRPNLSKVQTSDLRPELPPLRSSSLHLPHSERLISAMERAPISPALSDTSQRHAPSLVSDNQSMYSISPRTVTTPRPGIPAPVEVRNSAWGEHRTSAQYHGANFSHKSSFQAEPYLRYSNSVPSDSTLSRYSVSNLQEEKSKDSRMNVSTLLQ